MTPLDTFMHALAVFVAAAFILGTGLVAYLAWAARDVVRPQVVAFRNHVYEITRVDENGEPTLRRIQ